MAASRARWLVTASRTGRGGKAAPALLKWRTLATPGVSDLSNGTSSVMTASPQTPSSTGTAPDGGTVRGRSRSTRLPLSFRCPHNRRVGRNVMVDDEGVGADLGVIAD